MRRFSWCLAVLALTACGADGQFQGGTGGGTGGSSGFDAAACTDTWAGFGANFFSSACSRCHAGYDSQATVQASATGLASVIGSGAMPRGGGLSNTLRARAVLYLNCGAP